MKHLLFISAAVCSLALCRHAQAQTADGQAAQKAWMEYMTPGNIHQMLAKADGEWTYEATSWMDPNGEPTKSTGTSVSRMILGGRYQESRNTGNFAGMPFEGISLLGYDNAKKMFQSTWVDNFGTGIMIMEGNWDEASKTITLTGKGYDPTSGKDMTMKQTTKWVDDDHQLMEMFIVADGKDVKTMELKLTRKK